MAWTYKLVQNSLGYFFEIFIVIYVCDLSHNSEEIKIIKKKIQLYMCSTPLIISYDQYKAF